MEEHPLLRVFLHILFVYESSASDESEGAFPDMVAEQVAVADWREQMSWVVAGQASAK